MSEDEARERPASTSRLVYPEQTDAERARASRGRIRTIPGLTHSDEAENAEDAVEAPKPKKKK